MNTAKRMFEIHAKACGLVAPGFVGTCKGGGPMMKTET